MRVLLFLGLSDHIVLERERKFYIVIGVCTLGIRQVVSTFLPAATEVSLSQGFGAVKSVYTVGVYSR